ncbi:MAG TPA: hypothetical protein VIV60_06610 [Polyangiaceae bacterium]
MTDPERIIDGPDGALAANLLRTLRTETPPAHAHARALKSLGIAASAGGAITGSAKAAAASLAEGTSRSVSAWTATSILKLSFGGGVAAMVAAAIHIMPAPATSAQRVACPASVGPLAHESITRLGSTPLASSTVSQFSGTASAPITPARERTVPRNTPDPNSTRPAAGSSSLAREVEWLDKARAANAAHDAARTLQILDGYQLQFSEGILGPEAQLLRVEALVQSGRISEALPLARRMLESAPRGPHAERIIALLPSAVSEELPSIIRSDESTPATSE